MSEPRPTLYQHQREIADFIEQNRRALVFADPGTGKTAAVLEAIERLGEKAVVLCPKSIMWPAWVRDCQTFTPGLSIDVASAPASNRKRVFTDQPDIAVINHDGAKWLMENQQYLEPYSVLVLDESTAFKNKDAQRSKAVNKIREHFDARVAMTGTPISNGLLDAWHQVYLVDDGEHLGERYYAFRATTHDPVLVAADIYNWIPKPGAVDAVADMIGPISLRYTLEECIDIPEHVVTQRSVPLSPKLQRHYKEMEETALLELEEGEEVQAVHAAAQLQKLLQIASGSVYGYDHAYQLASERYDLIADLINERPHPSLVAFQWKHQRDGLIRALEKAGIDSYAVLDGDNNADIDDLVRRFQNGEYRCLLAHPMTAGHGLTLTAAKTVIWASPTYNAELYDQFNRRIYRAGQDSKTETILIAGAGTVDEKVIEKFTGKIDTQATALDLIKAYHRARQTAEAA